VCAARGHLHRQPASQLVFDPPPKSVTMSAFEGDPLSPKRYAPRVVYAIELCTLTRLCTNGAALFELEQLQQFVCQWREGALRELVHQIEAGRVWRGDGEGGAT